MNFYIVFFISKKSILEEIELGFANNSWDEGNLKQGSSKTSDILTQK